MSRLLPVESYCRLGCAYCASLGFLAEPSQAKSNQEFLGAAAGDRLLPCNAVFSPPVLGALERAGTQKLPSLLIHSGMRREQMRDFFHRIEHKNTQVYFLVDRLGFAWRDRNLLALEFGFEANFILLVRRSVSLSLLMQEVPEELRLKTDLLFADADQPYADFYIPDEAVWVMRGIAQDFPDWKIRAFPLGANPYFDSLEEADYRVSIPALGKNLTLRKFLLRAEGSGWLWWPARLWIRWLALLAWLIVDRKKARDLFIEQERERFWTTYHVSSEGIGRVRYGYGILSYCMGTLRAYAIRFFGANWWAVGWVWGRICWIFGQAWRALGKIYWFLGQLWRVLGMVYAAFCYVIGMLPAYAHRFFGTLFYALGQAFRLVYFVFGAFVFALGFCFGRVVDLYWLGIRLWDSKYFYPARKVLYFCEYQIQKRILRLHGRR